MFEVIPVSEINQLLPQLLERVGHGESIALEQNRQIVAMFTPPTANTGLKISSLNRIFSKLPKLGEDAALFEGELNAIRQQVPTETNAWD